MTTIIGIPLENRIEESIKLQEILSKYGCSIKTRIGLHDMGDYKCLNYGVVLIEVVNNINEIYDSLAKYWKIQSMKKEWYVDFVNCSGIICQKIQSLQKNSL